MGDPAPAIEYDQDPTSRRKDRTTGADGEGGSGIGGPPPEQAWEANVASVFVSGPAAANDVASAVDTVFGDLQEIRDSMSAALGKLKGSWKGAAADAWMGHVQSVIDRIDLYAKGRDATKKALAGTDTMLTSAMDKMPLPATLATDEMVGYATGSIHPLFLGLPTDFVYPTFLGELFFQAPVGKDQLTELRGTGYAEGITRDLFRTWAHNFYYTLQGVTNSPDDYRSSYRQDVVNQPSVFGTNPAEFKFELDKWGEFFENKVGYLGDAYVYQYKKAGEDEAKLGPIESTGDADVNRVVQRMKNDVANNAIEAGDEFYNAGGTRAQTVVTGVSDDFSGRADQIPAFTPPLPKTGGDQPPPGGGGPGGGFGGGGGGSVGSLPVTNPQIPSGTPGQDLTPPSGRPGLPGGDPGSAVPAPGTTPIHGPYAPPSGGGLAGGGGGLTGAIGGGGIGGAGAGSVSAGGAGGGAGPIGSAAGGSAGALGATTAGGGSVTAGRTTGAGGFGAVPIGGAAGGRGGGAGSHGRRFGGSLVEDEQTWAADEGCPAVIGSEERDGKAPKKAEPPSATAKVRYEPAPTLPAIPASLRFAAGPPAPPRL